MISESIKGAAGEYLRELAGVDFKPGQVQHRIDGVMYTSAKLPTSIGLELWPRITALLGAALTRTVATGEGEVDFGMIQRIAEAAARVGLVPICADLLQRVQCGKLRSTGKPGAVMSDFEEHFAGEYAHLAKVCGFALAHNLRGPTYGAP